VAPLFQGIGTHYSSLWVGTPPQRQSVIVDTGSHYTAFPCEGCVKCGPEYHTDPLFLHDRSESFEQMQCGGPGSTSSSCQVGSCAGGRCEFSQSYTEGSSWRAFAATDVLWAGRDSDDPLNAQYGASFSIPFTFGCQFSEAGLFETQLANGIMGMSDHDATFAKQLFVQGRIQHEMFTMCFQRHDE
jgi:hypothetical protein